MTFNLNKIYNIFHFLEYKTETYKYTLGIETDPKTDPNDVNVVTGIKV